MVATWSIGSLMGREDELWYIQVVVDRWLYVACDGKVKDIVSLEQRQNTQLMIEAGTTTNQAV